jgi:hypothetical protein
MFHLFLFTNLDLTLLQKVSLYFAKQQAFNFSYQGSQKGKFVMLPKGFNSTNKFAFWTNVTIPSMGE